MLSILAPSKTMDFKTPMPYDVPLSHPPFINDAKIIAEVMRKLSKAELEMVIKASPAINDRVHAMYAHWQEAKQKPALWTYVGDVYKGMKANHLDQKSAQWAQQHIVTMSGLYGIVRPYDLISEYRLEMQAKVPVGESKDLYDFWGAKLSDYAAKHANGIVCNLSSDEYGKPVTSRLSSDIRVITPLFFDNRPNGKVGRAPIYNKMMRGVMARWVIDQQADTPDDLKHFMGHGYTYSQMLSEVNAPAYFRDEMKPLIF